MNYILVVFLFLFCTSCRSQSDISTGDIPYDLNKHDDKQKLDDKLEEISGLSAINQHKIACIQDEKGNIYLLDIEQEEIAKKIDFAKSGDYEGIAIIETTAFVVESDGDIHEVKNFGLENQVATKYKTFLSAKNNVEGLVYDPTQNRLLVACKGDAGEGKEYKGKKAIYAFDLTQKKLMKQPAFLIDIKNLQALLKTTALQKKYEKIAEVFGIDEGSLTFQPSGIAIHPVSNNIYIIASVGKLLLVLDQTGEIIALESLKDKGFKQPEGITFLPSGDMVISNEGREGKANLMFFKYRFN